MKISHLLEAIVLWLAFFIFGLMPAEMASACGGWIGRTIGPHLGASKKALDNLRHAFPQKPESDLRVIVRDMWDNLGRVIAEYPHLKTIIQNHTEIIGEQNLQAIGQNNPCIIIGGHFANWELLPFYFNYKIDWPVSGLYRAPNNPYAEYLLDRARNPEERGNYIPKSRTGTRDMIRTLQEGKRLALLIDQKYNAGIAVPFMGRPAMTSPAFAQLAEKFQCPLLPFQVERIEGCNFRLTIHPPFYTKGQGEETMVAHAHALLESWVRQHPAQWLWLHRRWNSKALQQSEE